MSTPPAHFLTRATRGLARYADHLTRRGLHEMLIEQLAGAHRLQRDVQFLNLTQAVAESFDGLTPAQIEAVSPVTPTILVQQQLRTEPHRANLETLIDVLLAPSTL